MLGLQMNLLAVLLCLGQIQCTGKARSALPTQLFYYPLIVGGMPPANVDAQLLAKRDTKIIRLLVRLCTSSPRGAPESVLAFDRAAVCQVYDLAGGKDPRMVTVHYDHLTLEELSTGALIDVEYGCDNKATTMTVISPR